MVGGIFIMIIIIPINSKLSSGTSVLYKNNMKYKDLRSKLITELINNFKSIKLYSWERPMLDKIRHARNNLEVKNLIHLSV